MKSVAFYSYKGGSGRSTACVNFIYYFARNINANPVNPLILVDCDLDSAGLTYLLERNCKNKERFVNNGNGKFFSINTILRGDKADGNGDRYDIRGYNDFYGTTPINENRFFQDMIPVGDFFDLPANAVLFLPCDLEYDNKSHYNLSVQSTENFEVINDMAEKYSCSGIIYDCPAGMQDLAQLSIQQVENIICCMRPTYQFRRGTVDSLIKYIEKNDFGLSKQIIICPNAVSRKQMKFYGFEYPQTVKENLELEVFKPVKNFADKRNPDFTVRSEMLHNSPANMIARRSSHLADEEIIGIPEVERFKWFEECLGTIRCENDDEELAIERYQLLASLIE